MRVHVKLILMFLAESLLLVTIGLAVNGNVQKHYNEQMLERIKNQIDIAAEQFQKDLQNIDQYILELSISNETNIFSMYTWEKNRASIYEKSELFHQQLQAMKSNYKGLDNLWLIFTIQERQITDQVRYEPIDWEVYEMLRSANDGLLIDQTNLYYVSLLSTSMIYGDGSLVAAKVDLLELLDEFTRSVGSVEVRLSYSGIPVVDSSFSQRVNYSFLKEWQKEKSGWTMVYPLAIDSENKQNMYLEIFLSNASLNILRQSYLIWNVIMILIGIAEIIIAYMLLRRLVVRPLNTLTYAFEQVSCGNMGIEIQYNGKNDFADVYYQFNMNTKRLNQLIEKEYKLQMAIREAEVKYLQEQIKPHFLYNAFYQMYRLCRAEGGEESAEFALLLAGYYEYITHDYDKEGVVLLSEEVNQAEKYMRIQQFRFDDNIQFEFYVPEEIKRNQVPKLILQPIIENAVKHGFEEREIRSPLFVKVTGKVVNDHLVFIIEDNGSELGDEDIVRMQQDLSVSNSVYGRSGLVNTHIRLKMTSAEGGITLSRSQLGGLKVEIKMGRKQ